MSLLERCGKIGKTIKWGIDRGIEKIKSFSRDVEAMLLLLLGIAIMAAAIVVAVHMAPLALLAIAVAVAGTFIGTFIIAGALRRFSPSVVSSVSSELEKLKKEKTDAESKLNEELSKNEQLERSLKSKEKECSTLERRLSMFANVTKIQPELKLEAGKFSFDITDFCEEKIPGEKDGTPQKHLLSGHYHQVRDFYRGVYKYSGELHLAADLAKINIYETDDEITIYGPFYYSPTISLDYEEKWLMPGRRERESLKGDTPEDMEVTELTVTKTRDEKNAEKQVQQVRQNLRNLKIIDSMECFTDNIVVEFVKAILKTFRKGGQVRAEPSGGHALRGKNSRCFYR
ncbi:MAG: hypothetical protein IJT50_03885 [Lentisphaeria bacterium]|nr:hypothetical protein [Lentisphaeria bacterium]